MDDALRKYFSYLLSHETVILAVFLYLQKCLFSTEVNESQEQGEETVGS